MADKTLFTEKVRNPQKLNEWIPLRKVIGNDNNEVTSIQFYNAAGELIDVFGTLESIEDIGIDDINNVVDNFPNMKNTVDGVNDIGLNNINEAVNFSEETINYTVTHGQNTEVIPYTGQFEVVDSLVVDSHGRLLALILKKLQLPHSSVVAQASPPTADETLLWIKEEENTNTKSTIKVSKTTEPPENSDIRIWVVGTEQDVEGIISKYLYRPSHSSSIIWVKDNIAYSETLGTAYTGLEEPTNDELIWTKTEL